MNNGVENNQAVSKPTLVPTDTNNIQVNTIQNGINMVTPSMPVNSEAIAPIQQQPVIAPVNTTIVTTPITEQPTTDTTPPNSEPIIEEKEEPKKSKKKSSSLGGIVFIILVALGGFTYYTKTTSERTINELQYKCIPANESKEEKELDINSTLVQELYQKVATTINEDAAQPEWNDTMRIYLAYRQIPDYKKYETNCNLFSEGNMEPYTCNITSNFTPKAFKTETLELEWKKLFGETTRMPYINVKLQNTCIGGYEYISDRQEYVQGYCKKTIAPTYKVKKELKKAVTSNNIIILTEEVEYFGTDKVQVPDYLVSGTYYYTFRLDTNHNFILLSKDYDQKYE